MAKTVGSRQGQGLAKIALHKFWLVCVALCLCAGHAKAAIRLDDKFPWTEEQVGFRLAGADCKTLCGMLPWLAASIQARSRAAASAPSSFTTKTSSKPMATPGATAFEGWRYMTVLLRLREQDGKVLIEQDDSCLKNPNLHSDLAKARKALAACAVPQPR